MAALTLRDSLLPVVDTIRGIPGLLGLRLFSVSVHTRTWSGTRAGAGSSVDFDTSIRQDLGLVPVKVRQLTETDAVNSGGVYSSQDIEVGPITPPFAGSTLDNDAIGIFEPQPGTSPVEIFFRVTGPGLPAGGASFKKISQKVDKAFRYMFILRKTGEQF